MTADPTDTIPVAASLRAMKLVASDAELNFEPLTGGISSYIWKVTANGTALCVKRARPQLAVAELWEVPVGRNHYEAEFLRVAAEHAPDLAPPLLGEDPDAGLLVMPYLDPEHWRVWKDDLLAGTADVAVATALAGSLARLQCSTAHNRQIARLFATDNLFDAIRLDPYLRQCGRVHPRFCARLDHLIATTKTNRCTLVHGDVSPKNVLTGPVGVRLLDAECAWHGDPAFDAAFCLNHFLLKIVHRPAAAASYGACFTAFCETYIASANWEPAADLRRRTGHLLAGLLLARVDGKSPVEYLNSNDQKNLVREMAFQFLASPADDPTSILSAMLERLRR